MKLRTGPCLRLLYRGKRLYFHILILPFFITPATAQKMAPPKTPDSILLRLSEKLLYAVKTEESPELIEKELAGLSYERLRKGLPDDNAIKTFWLNMYNAWYQLLATRYELKNPKIFKTKKIVVAHKKFSLDEIEHGILRKHRWKYSKGYFTSFFPGKIIKQLAVQKIDYRIHFALNCGAKSCPPIAFYNYENIDRQLSLAEKTYLRSDTKIDTVHKKIHVTKLMNWFAADFGGKRGIRKIAGQVFNRNLSSYKIRYKQYNWEKMLHHFAPDPIE